MDCFELLERPIPEPDDGEVLLRTLYQSVDPYMRGRMRDAESYSDPWAVGEPLQAGVVGEVVRSRHDDWTAGDVAVGRGAWAAYAAVDGDRLTPVDPGLGPISTALGVLGMPGRTAYFGTLAVADPTPGDTVVVSAAAGAVGSVAGQIAAHAGCDVIGIAGTGEKIDWIESIGFDAGINYERETVGQRLDDVCAGLPGADGVDVYFDNVGGPITDAVFERLTVDARVAVCGQISLYNAEETPTGPRKLPGLISTRARVEGFLVRDFADRRREATERLARWVDAGVVDYRETVTDGLENAPKAFLGLFDGANVGKQLVNVAEREG